MELTTERALRICFKEWVVIADNPKLNKCQALKKARLPEMENECSCCEYVKQKGKNCGVWNGYGIPRSSRCAPCLLKFFWTGGCLSKKSSYCKWEKAQTDEKRTEYATEIAMAAWNELCFLGYE